MQILWWLTCSAAELDASLIPPPAIPYKLQQLGLGAISGYATRLPIATQRQLLAEAAELVRLSGSPYSIKRTLELFGYIGATLNENPIIDTVRRWGEFEVITQQAVRYAEVQAIVDLLKPPSRKLIAIRFINAILLDGSRTLNGTAILEGLAGVDDAPIPWLDSVTSLVPVAASTPVRELVNADSNLASNFNEVLQVLINRIRLEDNALAILANRISALNTALQRLGGGSIAPQIAAINAGLTTLTNSNNLLLNRLQSLTSGVMALIAKTNTLETQATTITSGSNARQLGVTVQRKSDNLDRIAALATTLPFPTTKVIASTPGNNVQWQNTPALGAFIPQIASLEFRQPAGTNAGNYPTAGVWAAMPFTIASNDDNFVTAVSASRYTLPAGTYIVMYTFQGCGCVSFGGRIWNQTAGSAIEQGTAGRTATGGGNVGDTWSAEGECMAVFQLAGNTNIEFQFRAEQLHPNGAALTAGQSTGNSVEQIFEEVVIWRISN